MYKLLFDIQSGNYESVYSLLDKNHSYYEFMLELAIRLGDTQGQCSPNKYVSTYRRIRFLAGVLYRTGEEAGTLLPTSLKKLAAIRIGQSEYSFDGIVSDFSYSVVNHLRQEFKATLKFLYDLQKNATENISNLSMRAAVILKQITVPQIKSSGWKHYAKKIAAMHIKREKDALLIDEINAKLLEAPRDREDTKKWKPFVEILLAGRDENALLELIEMFAGDHGAKTLRTRTCVFY